MADSELNVQVVKTNPVIEIHVTGAAAEVEVNVKPASLQGPKGDAFTYEDFTPEQLEGLRGPQGIQGEKGEKGDSFEYSDFTPEQLEGLRGPQGEVGPAGAKGDTGQPGQTGEPGPQGETGEAGVGIADVIIEEIMRPSPGVGGHKITVVLTDGRQYSFDVDDGKNGSTGPRGQGITEIKLAGAGVDQYGRHYQIIEIWWMFTSDAGVQPTVTSYTVYDGKDGEDATVVQEVEETGTDAVSGAAVAAYVDKRLAQAGLYVLIVEQPVPMTVNQGETASFTVAAEGKGLTYQWEYSVNEGTNWTESAESGSQTQTISFVAAKSQNGYKYRCVITDANGNNVISDAAMLTVKQGAVITQQPQSQAAVAGDTVTFSVEATGVASYQWQTTSNDGVSWDDLTWEGATTGTMTCTLNINTVTYKYRCKLTGTDGSVVYTDVIYFAPVLITDQPENVTGSIGDTVTFSLKANGYISMYRWQRSTDGGNTFSAVYWGNSGFDTDTFTFTINDDSRLNGLYRCVVYCSEGDEYNVISDVVSIISV